MNILFEGIDFTNIINDVYKRPKSSDIVDFLSQTKGMITNEIRQFLGRSLDLNCKVIYEGPLTVAQQWEILSDISDNNIHDIIYINNNNNIQIKEKYLILIKKKFYILIVFNIL